MLAMLCDANDIIDPQANIETFYENMWDVDTATGYGLDVWGRIVGVSRVVQVADVLNFGFEEAAAQEFGQAPFYNGAPTTDGYALVDDSFRTLIYAKALANISNGSIPAINQILLLLFPGRGNCYCTDGQNMTMTYTFDFTLSPVELGIVQNSGVLPKPTGVSFTVVQGA